MPEDDAMRWLEKELDRQGEALIEYRTESKAESAALREEVKDLPAIRKEAELVKDTLRQNTQVIYVLIGLIISSGALTALLKGVI